MYQLAFLLWSLFTGVAMSNPSVKDKKPRVATCIMGKKNHQTQHLLNP